MEMMIDAEGRGTGDGTAGNDLHYWSGRRMSRWSVAHSCFLGMPWMDT